MKRLDIGICVCLVTLIILGANLAMARSPYLYVGEPTGVKIFGKITETISGKPLQARVEVWYPKVGYVSEEGGKPVPRAEQAIRQLFHADYANEKGWYMVSVFPGDWLVRVTAGPEYAAEDFLIRVTKEETSGRRHNISLTRLYDLHSRGWYSIDVHHHTFASDAIHSRPEQMYEAAKSVGLDAVVLTDHNTVAAYPEWSEYNNEKFLAVSGVEMSAVPSKDAQPHKAFSHANALGVVGLPGATDPTNPSWGLRYQYSSCQNEQRAIDETHAMGGLYMINHPMQARYRLAGSFACFGEVKNFDAIEFNGGYGAGPFLTYLLGTDPARVTYWNADTLIAQVWFEFLNAGNKVAAWGSSDTHDTLELGDSFGTQGLHRWNKFTGNQRTYVRSGELTWPAVKDALKKGKAFVNNGAYGLLLLVDSQGKGPGDEVKVGPNGVVPLTIEVLANRPLEGFEEGIRIIQGGKIIKTIPTEAGQWTIKIDTEVKINSAEDTWLVVQAFGQWPSMAITNAIYLDVAPYGKWGAAKWTVPKGAATWNNPWPLVPDITVPDGPSRPEYKQPEPAVGYNRPMNRETAERLLTEEYKINKVKKDVSQSKAFEYLK
jgi:hypothetical protein